jgi:ATP-dependent Clp protease protease subunit
LRGSGEPDSIIRKDMDILSSPLLQHRILFLSEEITRETSCRMIPELLLLDADNHELPIDLYINSPGGNITAGLAIIDTMQCIQAPVSTICIGMAASMAAMILAAGAPGQRHASPNSEVMIHQSSGGFQGQTSTIRIYAQRMQRQEEQLVDLLAQWTGQKKERITTDIQNDYFMTAKEAKAYGIVDTILDPFHPKTLRKPGP